MLQSKILRIAAVTSSCMSIVQVAVAQDARPSVSPALRRAMASIEARELLRHTTVLASDEFEGRAPGTRGEELTIRYLTEQFQRFRLEPGNPQGTWVQPVPLVRHATRGNAVFEGTSAVHLQSPTDFVIRPDAFGPVTRIENSDVVFVGYGFIAPELGWDDYGDANVTGKTVVMLNVKPGMSVQHGGKDVPWSQVSRYGMPGRRVAAARQKGAAAVLLIEDGALPAASLRGGRLQLEDSATTTTRFVMARVRADAADRLIAAGGQNLSTLREAAGAPAFQPVALTGRFSMSVETQAQHFKSANVIARLTGSDPVLRNEYVVYTAHWDHLGRDSALKGDQIFNGALDNAAGVAQLLEIAKAFATLSVAPKRTMLFIATTAEESGLLGAHYYVAHPTYRLDRTLANINLDGANPVGRTTDVVNVGEGNTTLDELLADAARAQGRVVAPDPMPEENFFERSDNFEFVKAGVPALQATAGLRAVGKPEGYGLQMAMRYLQQYYHKVSDEVTGHWDMSGAAEDAQLFAIMGYWVAQGARYPEWKAQTKYPQFKALREKALKHDESPVTISYLKVDSWLRKLQSAN